MVSKLGCLLMLANRLQTRSNFIEGNLDYTVVINPGNVNPWFINYFYKIEEEWVELQITTIDGNPPPIITLEHSGLMEFRIVFKNIYTPKIAQFYTEDTVIVSGDTSNRTYEGSIVIDKDTNIWYGEIK